MAEDPIILIDMRVLVACEYSGVVRDAFAKRGHYAASCDLLPTEIPGVHYQMDVLEIIQQSSSKYWDLIIAFPPCTYLCSSGLHWNKRRPERAAQTDLALQFVCSILNADCDKIALENSIGCISTRIVVRNGRYIVNDGPDAKAAIKPAQIIQPYEFGSDASKSTCLFLKGLMPLTLDPKQYVAPRIVNGKPRWANQTDSGQNKLAPSEKRWQLRSKTYPGVAKAMAEQWG